MTEEGIAIEEVEDRREDSNDGSAKLGNKVPSSPAIVGLSDMRV
jgi:hypothetical protein